MEKQVNYIDIIGRGASFAPVITEEQINKEAKLVINSANFVLNGKTYPVGSHVIDSSELWLDYTSGSYKKAEFECKPGAYKILSSDGDKINLLRFVEQKSVFKRVMNEITQFRFSV